jgi:hypothetical protein
MKSRTDDWRGVIYSIRDAFLPFFFMRVVYTWAMSWLAPSFKRKDNKIYSLLILSQKKLYYY